tara:strand:+ start:1084 stop:1623 length:540 start_codon:yes stop_codon:yes gene_type:complete
MDSFEINKIIAAVLLIALIVIGIGKISDVAFKVNKPEKSAYKIDIPEDSSKLSSKVEKVVEKVDIEALLALGDISHGEKVFKKCAACHLVNKGGANKIGPALYGVLGRKVASKKDYKYSKAMASYDKDWTFEEMNGYLKKPQSYIKGTKMAFAGLRKEKDRASVILYLNKNSDNPLPLP